MGERDWGTYSDRLADALEGGREAEAAGVISTLAREDRLGQTDGGGRTALHVAAALGRLDLCERLLAAGASAGARDLYGASPLAGFGSRLEAGADGAAALELFGAYGGGRPQAAYAISYRPQESLSIGAVAALSIFFSRLDRRLGAATLPRLLARPLDTRGRQVWLSEGEVPEARRIVEAEAEAEGYAGKIVFERAGAAVAPAAG